LVCRRGLGDAGKTDGFFDEESVSGVVCMRDDCLKTDREIKQVCAWSPDVEHCSASRFACRVLASITCEV
jgi:hypothetical protein